MVNKKYAVTGIGNAIIDIVSLVEEEFLEENGFTKGSMILIDNQEAQKLSHLKHQTITSGGSVANTIATLAALGVSSALIGKVGDDEYGRDFANQLKEAQADFYCNNKSEPGSTARSFVLVTQDGLRTMCTHLGKASEINDEIDEQLIAGSKILYLEGYLWDKEETITALKQSIKIAKQHNNLVAFTLSDSFCVIRHKADFLELIQQELDILFSNEDEIKALLAMPEIDLAKLQKLTASNPKLIIVITRHEKGALIIENSNNKMNYYDVPTKQISPIDVTGAGDCFAAGFLYGFTRGLALKKCAEIGNLAAGLILEKFGARLDKKQTHQLQLYLLNKN